MLFRSKNSAMPMDNYVVTQGDGVVNVIYLIIGPEKFISLRPSSIKVTDLVNLMDIAVNISQEIKGYK